MKLDDLTGRTFDFLYVVKRTEDRVMPNGKRKTQYLCRCECGKELNVLRQNLISGHTSSCGCIRIQSGVCVHNRKGVLCEERKCSECGWNPCNTKLKRQRLRKLKERMREK